MSSSELREAKLARLKAWEAVCTATAKYGEACAHVALLERGPETPRVTPPPVRTPSSSIRLGDANQVRPLPPPSLGEDPTVVALPFVGARVMDRHGEPDPSRAGTVRGIFGGSASVEWDHSQGNYSPYPLADLRVLV